VGVMQKPGTDIIGFIFTRFDSAEAKHESFYEVLPGKRTGCWP